jgi:hypothetical protein
MWLVLIAAAVEPTVAARVAAEDVTLGDSFDVTVEVVRARALTVSLPATLDLGPAFAEESRSIASRDNGDGTVTDTFSLTVGAYDVGDLELPAIPLTYMAGGERRTLQTLPIPVEVQSYVGEGEEELRPIAGPVDVMRRDMTLVYGLAAVGGAFALVIAIGVARWAWRRRAVPQPIAAEAPVVPPQEEALARLKALESSGALDAENLEPAYTALSEIVRVYLGRRFGFPAPDLTTDEINADLARRDEAAPVRDDLRQWFAICDVVKFAEYPSSADEARAALYQARQIVQRTAPAVEATGG